MVKSKTFHHAFRVTYKGKPSALISEAGIALPSATDPNPQKKFFKYNTIWDTGSTNTVITKKVVTSLSLVPTGKAKARGIHAERLVDTYIVDILLRNNVLISNITVSESNLIGNIDLLIGMDIIQLGDFAIANAGGNTTFSYCLPPHTNPIDLLEKSERVNPKKKPLIPIPLN